MPQLSKGDTFVNGQQVSANRLNQLVDSAIILVGSISEQTAIASNGVSASDEIPINDGGVLKKATASDILNSGLAITTGSVSGNTGADLVITPSAGQKVDIAGNLEADDINVTDDLTVGDDLTVSGDLTVTGTTTQTGTLTANGGVVTNGTLTSNGVANFTGGFQINGTNAGVFLGYVEENIPKFTATNNAQLYTAFTSGIYTKPAGEVWVIEFYTTWLGNSGRIHYRVTNSADTTVYQMKNAFIGTSGDPANIFDSFILDSASTYNDAFVLRTYNSQSGVILNPNSTDWTGQGYQGYNSNSKFRIFKYKV